MRHGQAYYNEHDPFAAAMLREAIAAGLVCPGHVDERDIRDVLPADLEGFSQHHFFAGVGVWSAALRGVGWPDTFPIWTGSCPCQPFSEAGAGAGFADERHVWPFWQWLVEVCGPELIVGEQVGGKDADPWLDLVQADVEALDYAFGCTPFPAAGIGAPHIRHRNYWVADATSEQWRARWLRAARDEPGSFSGSPRLCAPVALADAYSDEERERGRPGSEGAPRHEPGAHASGRSKADQLGLTVGARLEGQRGHGDDAAGRQPGQVRPVAEAGDAMSRAFTSGALHGFWRNADWLFGRDGRWRPVNPGTFPLAYGARNRVGILRCAGNALCKPQAEEYLRTVIEQLRPAA